MRTSVDCREMSQGHEEGHCGGKCLWRKVWQSRRQGNTAESYAGMKSSL